MDQHLIFIIIILTAGGFDSNCAQEIMHNTVYCDITSTSDQISWTNYSRHTQDSLTHFGILPSAATTVPNNTKRPHFEHPSGSIKPLDRRKGSTQGSQNVSYAASVLIGKRLDHGKQDEDQQCVKKAVVANSHQIEFVTSIVKDELIVKFDGYYTTKHRKQLLLTALSHCDIPNANYDVLHRANPAAKFPSDFDVLEVHKMYYNKVKQLIQLHRNISYITRHIFCVPTSKYLAVLNIAWFLTVAVGTTTCCRTC